MKLYTVNVDIFACTDFQGFMTMVNFACVKTPVSSITGYYKNNYATTKQISNVYIFSWIFKKHKLRENMYHTEEKYISKGSKLICHKT